MAITESVINGVTKVVREENISYEFALYRVVLIISTDTIVYYSKTGREVTPESVPFASLTDNKGATDGEEYLDLLATEGAFFLPIFTTSSSGGGSATKAKQDDQITLATTLNGIVATEVEQQAQTTILGNILIEIGNVVSSFIGLAKEAKQDAIIALQTTLNSIVSTSAKQDDIISAIQFSDSGFGERYMGETQDFQANTTGYYGISVVRLKTGETRNVFIEHISVENQNADDYQLIVFEYDRDSVPSVLNNATIAYSDLGASCERSIVTQTGGANTSGIINTFGQRKDGLWVNNRVRSGDFNPKIKMNPLKEYLLAVETLTNGSDIYESTTILEKPL